MRRSRTLLRFPLLLSLSLVIGACDGPGSSSGPLRELIVSYSDGTNKLQLYRINEDGHCPAENHGRHT